MTSVYELTYRTSNGRIDSEDNWSVKDIDDLRKKLIADHYRYHGTSKSIDVNNYASRKYVGTLVFGTVNKWKTENRTYPIDPKTGKLIR